MPRLFGLNIIASLVAGLAFWMLGYLWYGNLFLDPWTAMQNFTPEQEAYGEANMGMLMGLGFLIALISSGFIGFVLRKIGATELVDTIKMSLVLCFGFVALTQLYDVVYALEPMHLFFIDAGYQVIGFPLMAAIHTLMANVMVKD
ncbi:DUF1761 domain-containing protein [Maricaulis sp.]|uniref:DUF1761 domain-containing protein n=1 Tax=unclassified Maricaulis TaxID=2632371 RepID=UPI001B184D6E|nr:DUF1761 domain-containing protein [Maricaulis sp.]MBO6796950.1 DUF1761 domain-containing protein [Maricaulis sp.]